MSFWLDLHSWWCYYHWSTNLYHNLGVMANCATFFFSTTQLTSFSAPRFLIDPFINSYEKDFMVCFSQLLHFPLNFQKTNNFYQHNHPVPAHPVTQTGLHTAKRHQLINKHFRDKCAITSIKAGLYSLWPTKPNAADFLCIVSSQVLTNLCLLFYFLRPQAGGKTQEVIEALMNCYKWLAGCIPPASKSSPVFKCWECCVCIH